MSGLGQLRREGEVGGVHEALKNKQKNLILAYEKVCFSITLPPFFLQYETKSKHCRFSRKGKKPSSIPSILTNQSFNRL